MSLFNGPSALLYRRLIKQYVLRYRRTLLIGGVCMLFTAGAAASQAYLMQPVLDDIFVKKNEALLILLPLLLIAAAFIGAVGDYGQSLALKYVGQRVVSDMQGDLNAMAEFWRHGSVVRSWLLDLTATALQDPGAMEKLAPVVADSGEGRWTVDEAIRQGTPVPVISAALMARFSSQGKADTSNRLLSLMRKGFGGHQTVEKP